MCWFDDLLLTEDLWGEHREELGDADADQQGKEARREQPEGELPGLQLAQVLDRDPDVVPWLPLPRSSSLHGDGSAHAVLHQKGHGFLQLLRMEVWSGLGGSE